MTPKLKVLLAVFISCVVLDQATKQWVLANLAPNNSKVVLIPNYLEFIHAENTGAAWSTLSDSPYRLYIFAVFTVIAVASLLHMFRALGPDERFRAASTGLILSGAIGNAIDRTMKGSVTDFIKVFIGEGDGRKWLIENVGSNVWPIWNIADAAIVVGVILFSLEYFFEKDTPAKQEGDVGPNPMKTPENSTS